jgi:uncharacterized caspase-like protein
MKELFRVRFGIPDTNIVTLINEKATLATIRDYLEDTYTRLTENSTLYVYYSGHGGSIKPRDGSSDVAIPYIIPYDGNPANLANTAYSLQSLYASLDKLRVKNSFVFVDSCFSGAVTGRYASGVKELFSGARAIQYPIIKDPLLLSRSVVSFTSSQGGELSMSSEVDRLGLFTSEIVKALMPDSPLLKGEPVTVEKFFTHLKGSVYESSLAMYGINRVQTPTLIPNPIDERKEILMGVVK